jgi:hypothetical protein
MTNIILLLKTLKPIKMTQETRQNVIDTIIDLAGDEFETPADYIQLARETPEELIHRLIGIACYYRDEVNS